MLNFKLIKIINLNRQFLFNFQFIFVLSLLNLYLMLPRQADLVLKCQKSRGSCKESFLDWICPLIGRPCRVVNLAPSFPTVYKGRKD